jgi:uncharacterized membrane protein
MFLKLYFITLPIFLGIDAVWLSLMSKLFYQRKLGFIMSKSPNLLAAFIFYLLYATGLVVFVLIPSLDKRMWVQALLSGALFGLICYATYDLSNLATVKDWPLSVTIVDLIWGTSVSAIVSLIVYFIGVRLGL